MTKLFPFLQMADVKMKAYQAENAHRHRNAPPAHVARPVPIASIAPAMPVSSDIMDLTASRRQVSPQERDARLHQRRCFYCGGIGHMSSICPVWGRRAGVPGSRPDFCISAAATTTVETALSVTCPQVPVTPALPAGNA